MQNVKKVLFKEFIYKAFVKVKKCPCAPEMWLSGTVLAYHAFGRGFYP